MEDELVQHQDPIQKCQISKTSITWRQELDCHHAQVEDLQEKLKEVKASIQCSDDVAKELSFLWRGVKANAALLSYLTSKARIMAFPHLACSSCGINQQESVGFIDRHGVPLSDWSKDVDLSSFENLDGETLFATDVEVVPFDANDGAYISEMLKAAQMVSHVMESLLKRAIIAESETAIEKEKVNLGKEEVRKTTMQIETMSEKVKEMEKFAVGTNSILNDMRQRVEDMVQETSRQRQRAAENEQELSRMKHDFEALSSYVSSLISVRETLLSSEKQFQKMEKLFERLVAKTRHLENEKMQKEAEVQKLMEENVRLSAVLDQKEAQLLAMNEQFKVMALNDSGI